MRGGAKKYYVYVRDPSSGNVKKVTWGDTTGLKVKLNDPAMLVSHLRNVVTSATNRTIRQKRFSTGHVDCLGMLNN